MGAESESVPLQVVTRLLHDPLSAGTGSMEKLNINMRVCIGLKLEMGKGLVPGYEIGAHFP